MEQHNRQTCSIRFDHCLSRSFASMDQLIRRDPYLQLLRSGFLLQLQQFPGEPHDGAPLPPLSRVGDALHFPQHPPPVEHHLVTLAEPLSGLAGRHRTGRACQVCELQVKKVIFKISILPQRNEILVYLCAKNPDDPLLDREV